MQWGLIGTNVGIYAEPEHAVALAQSAEAAGFDSLWTYDHVVIPQGYASHYPYSPSGRAPGLGRAPMPDSLVWLSYVAAHTSRILLGTGVLILPLRNPLVLAKQVASLDVLSGGRVRLGVGVGWLEEEFDAVGVPFSERGSRADESIEVMRTLWASDDASHNPGRWSFEQATAAPRPARGDIHITIGGHSPAAAKRAGRLGDGWFAAIDADSIKKLTLPGALERFVELIALMRQTAADCGRDPDALEVTLLTGRVPPQEAIDRLKAEGIHRCVLMVPTYSPAEIEKAVDRLAGRVGLG
ncbi:MAG: LLM class F420-dependent oxidoreductase [Acidimicrobiia bacterium]|nr:LLM class F420-dependent oxidoreductase [Acidimicrobiia bacterium]MDJ0664406.1 LLM class F420-dependent oxidoreductase [Acidimicrobiia bacterium]